MTRDEFEKNRISQLSELPKTTLVEITEMGKNAQEFINTPYWSIFEQNLGLAAKSFLDRKDSYSFQGKLTDPKGNIYEIQMALEEAKFDACNNIVQDVKFYITDGLLAEKILRSANEIKVVPNK